MNFKGYYFSTHGRFSRKQFWLTQLGLAGISLAIFFLITLVFKVLINNLNLGIVLFWFPWAIISTWIAMVACIKRFHDRNKSVWWLFIVFTFIVGPFWLLIECGFLKGTSGSNYYGQDPLLRQDSGGQVLGQNKVTLTEKPTFHMPVGIVLASNSVLFFILSIPRLVYSLTVIYGGITNKLDAGSAFQTGAVMGAALGSLVVYVILIGLLVLGIKMIRKHTVKK